MARALLDAGAAVDAEDEDGKPLLVVAAEAGYADLVELLLGRGAPIDDAGTEESRTGALGFAALEGHAEVVDLLLAHGATSTPATGLTSLP